MKTSELRIGNYVDTINRSGEIHLPSYCPKKVGNISFFEVELYDIDKSFAESKAPKTTKNHNLCPIELTEEWLLKLRFDYRDDDFYILNIPNKFKVYISISIVNDCYQLCQNGHGYSVDLKQLHKLQNLWFALTGEELTVSS